MKRKPLIDGHLGKTDKTRQIGAITFTEATFTPNIKFPKHSHRNACFTLIHKGGYIETFERTVITAKPHSVIFRPPEESHSDSFGSSEVCSSLIEIESEWFEHLNRETTVLNDPLWFDNGQIAWQAMNLCREFREPDDVSRLAIEGLAMEMLAKTVRTVRERFTRTPPRWLVQVKELLHDQFSHNLTLGYIAQTAGVHPSYLANVFREYYRSSIGEYMRRLRIEFVCREIVTTDSSLVEIALNAGYSHQAHFTNTFKRSTGMSPAKYRAIFRQS